MFSIGARYQWAAIAFLLGFIIPIPLWLANRYRPSRWFPFWNMPIILWYMCDLFVGIESQSTMYYTIGFLSQGYFRKRYPKLFVKYNYLLSAALDGGTQVIVFILSFAVFVGSGQARPFPIWATMEGLGIRRMSTIACTTQQMLDQHWRTDCPCVYRKPRRAMSSREGCRCSRPAFTRSTQQ